MCEHKGAEYENISKERLVDDLYYTALPPVRTGRGRKEPEDCPVTLLNVALECVRHGWYVFPCVPKDKRPLAGLAPRGFLDASNDEDTIRRWWTAKPDANVGIATGASGLLVVDIDHGLKEDADALMWVGKHAAQTYIVRTGRRPEIGLQLYFQADGSRNSAGWQLDGCSGDIRADGGYVMAAGSIHPSGHPYTVKNDAPVAAVPEWVKSLAPVKAQHDPATAVDDETADAWKTWLLEYADHNKIEVREFEKRAPNGWWLGIRCPWVHASGDGAESSTVLGILDGRLAFECSHGTCKAAKRDTSVFRAEMLRLHGPFSEEPGSGPKISLGTGLPLPQKSIPDDWRERYHSFDELAEAPEVSFLIDNFLPEQSITALAAPVRQRKSLIAINVAHALCTGEPLFGRFNVNRRPARVLYLCPEMGLLSFAGRVRKIGLMDYVGKTFFCRTMNKAGLLKLSELTEEELKDAVVIIDTLIRYQSGGEENSAKDMSVLSAHCFRLIEQGAAAVIPLHHSDKQGIDREELTLENVMRGSGELGAAMTNAFGTRLQDPNDEYGSLSYIQNVKPRDFKPDPKAFEVSCSEETCRMTFVPSEAKVVLKRRNRANRDGQEARALELIKANPQMSLSQLEDLLAKEGIDRKHNWISNKRRVLLANGSTLKSE
jgi:hypothetical protein